MTETEVLVQLISGNDWWNCKTHEYVYYNYDYDDGTLTSSEMILSIEGDDAYMLSSGCDSEVPQLETCRRIVGEDGWMRVDDPLTETYRDKVRKRVWW